MLILNDGCHLGGPFLLLEGAAALKDLQLSPA